MNREIKFRCWDGHKMWMVENWDELQSKEFNVMQFTGLLDRHGKEIFEGDIVGGGHEVCWISDGWHIKVKTPKGDRYHRICEGQDEIDFCDRKVIGNCYENPELINKI